MTAKTQQDTSQTQERRGWGSGGISWLDGATEESGGLVRLRIRVAGKTHSKTMTVRGAKRGGKGDLTAAMSALAQAAEAKEASHGSDVHTLRSLCDQYVELIEADDGRTQRTAESYRHVYKRLPKALMDRDVSTIEKHDLELALAKMRDKHGQPYAIRTRKHALAVLKATLEHFTGAPYLPTNPAKRLKVNGGEEGEQREITAAEVGTLARAAEDRGDWVMTMSILLASVTGLRRGELCGLKWSDLDPETGELRIARQFVDRRGGGQDLVKPKNKGTRSVHLGPGSLALVAKYRAMWTAELEHEPSGWLLSYYGGHRPLRAKSLTDAVVRLAKDNGLKGITPHSFRRFHESELIAEGVDPAAAAARLGHTPAVMWKSYVKARKDREVATGGAVDARLAAQGLTPAELLSGD